MQLTRPGIQQVSVHLSHSDEQLLLNTCCSKMLFSLSRSLEFESWRTGVILTVVGLMYVILDHSEKKIWV